MVSCFLLQFAFLFVLAAGCGESAGQNSGNSGRWEKIEKMYERYKQKSFPNTPDVKVEELPQIQKKQKVILVDVRTKKEEKVSTIPGAISKEEFEKNFDKYKNDLIVPYCTIGYRSGLYTKELLKKGLRARNLMGGVLAWAFAGKKFASPSGDSTRVHVYGKKWNLLPENYKGVY